MSEESAVEAILERGDPVEILRDIVLHRLKWPPLSNRIVSPWATDLEVIVQRVTEILAPPPSDAAQPEHTELIQRIGEAVGRIGKMCSEGRPPKMSIPVRPEDDDIFISETLVQCRDILRSRAAHPDDAPGGPTGWREREPRFAAVVDWALSNGGHMCAVDGDGPSSEVVIEILEFRGRLVLKAKETEQ